MKTRDKFVVYLDEKAREACTTLDEAKSYLKQEMGNGLPLERLSIKYNRMSVSIKEIN